ncbi:MAG: threonine--tRNA ligase [Patescibacteria group bacterium]
MSTKNNLEAIRHSLSHLMSMAVQELYPKAGLGVGPAIENGFYQDYDLPEAITPEILPKLEKRIKEIIKENIKFEQHDVDFDEAYKFYKHDSYKTGFIDDLKTAGEKKVSFYKSGWFDNLCAGPHVGSTKEINPEAFKLTKIAGAYWRGDEKNKMLTRIYGVAFESKKELNKHLSQVEMAKKRDHRKLGKELDLFCFSDLVGPGLPLFTPKGTIIIDELQKEVEKICRGYGFQKVKTPHLAKIGLYELSGHAQKFSDELFHVTSKRKQNYVMSPVLCPHQTQLFASRPRSYRDLPIRYMESEKMYRAEKPGEIGGLSRVIAITVEDGHSFCRVNQVKEEIKNMVNIIKDFYSSLGLWENHNVSLSVRDYAHPEKYIGDVKDWDECEKILQEVSEEMNLKAKRNEGEAALYGPKLDFMFKDALGKEIQIPTVQIDFATAKRFDLFYINEKGEKVAPAMVHRAILGSYERFLALLIEHFAGAFPLWLSPVQVEIIPVSEKFDKYAEKVNSLLLASDIRTEISGRSESLGKRISEAEKQKIPYILVVGEKEEKSESVAVRYRGGNPADAKAMASKQEVTKLEKFIEKVKKEIEEKK